MIAFGVRYRDAVQRVGILANISSIFFSFCILGEITCTVTLDLVCLLAYSMYQFTRKRYGGLHTFVFAVCTCHGVYMYMCKGVNVMYSHVSLQVRFLEHPQRRCVEFEARHNCGQPPLLTEQGRGDGSGVSSI